jgi:tripeptide aminopeptidase
VKQVFETAALAIGAQSQVRLNLAYKAIRVPEDARVVTVAKNALTSLGLEPRVVVIGGGTDASEYNEKGIQTVVLGTGVRSEHTTDEHIFVADMEKAVKMIQEILGLMSR